MPVEYWNPIEIYYNDISFEDFKEIKKEIYEKLTLDIFSNETWNDLVKTTFKYTNNILEKLKLTKLENIIYNNVKNYLQATNNSKNFYIVDCWFNKLPKYGHQGLHTHLVEKYNQKDLVSGVYFYEESVSLMEPVCFILNNGVKRDFPVRYDYIPGRIIIFPSSLPHRVNYNKNDEDRTSLSFNVVLV